MDRNRSGKSFIQKIQDARGVAQPLIVSPSMTDNLYRGVSIYLSVPLAKAKVSANQITVFWILLGLFGLVALAAPKYGVRVAGAVLINVSYLFDYVDGEVARLHGRSSRWGLFLDLVGHGLIKTALFLAIGYRIVLATGRFEYLILAILACVGISNGHATVAYGEVAGVAMQRRTGAVPTGTTSKSNFRKLLFLAGYAFESVGIFGTVLLGAILDRLDWVLLLYGCFGPL